MTGADSTINFPIGPRRRAQGGLRGLSDRILRKALTFWLPCWPWRASFFLRKYRFPLSERNLLRDEWGQLCSSFPLS